MLDFLKNLFLTEKEDILFAYRAGAKVGIVDAQSIEKYLNKNRAEKVYVFSEKEINESVRKYFDDIPETYLIKCDNLKKEMNKWEEKEEFKEKKIKRVSLDSFGSRPISRDPA